MAVRLLVAPLPSLAVLTIRGDDRIAWLQGQITNDVYRGGSLHAFRLDSNGKIEAELLARDDGNATRAIVDASRAVPLATSLDRRIVMEDVTVEVESASSVVGAYALDGELDPSAVDAPFIESRRFGLPGVEWIVPTERVETTIATLLATSRATLVDEARLDDERIARGMPRFGVDFDATLPQETGLVRSTVSFTKGCYVGQEPVVMLEHRGKPPRRMTTIRGDASLLAPFDLARADGTVVGRCTSFRNGVGLAIVKRADAVVGAELAAPGSVVTVVDLVEVLPLGSSADA